MTTTKFLETKKFLSKQLEYWFLKNLIKINKSLQKRTIRSWIFSIIVIWSCACLDVYYQQLILANFDDSCLNCSYQCINIKQCVHYSWTLPQLTSNPRYSGFNLHDDTKLTHRWAVHCVSSRHVAISKLQFKEYLYARFVTRGTITWLATQLRAFVMFAFPFTFFSTKNEKTFISYEHYY